MSELKLEVGKKYRTRNGFLVEVTNKLYGRTHPYVGDNGCNYSEDGRYLYTIERNEDLVEEITEPETKQQEIQPMLDKKYKYVAMDGDGYCKFFEVKPKPHEDVACWYSTDYDVPLIMGVFNLGNDWKESLREIIHNDDGSVYLRKPRHDFKVDDKVLVKAACDTKWNKRHFSHWQSDGTPICFMGGGTSFTTKTISSWDEIKPYVEE